MDETIAKLVTLHTKLIKQYGRTVIVNNSEHSDKLLGLFGRFKHKFTIEQTQDGINIIKLKGE